MRKKQTIFAVLAVGLIAGGLYLSSHLGHPTTQAAPNGLYRPPSVSKSSNCVVHEELPDSACTPGAVLAQMPDGRAMSAAVLCSPGFSTKSIRDVPQIEKDQVFAEYGIVKGGTPYEVDHLISLELGGSNDIANLWPEAGKIPNDKDAVENRLHDDVCAGKLSLADAQRIIATDWKQYASR